MNNDKHISLEWEKITREPVPDVSDLKASILAATEHQVQDLEPMKSRRTEGFLWFRAPRFLTQGIAAGVSGLAVLFIAVTVMSPLPGLSPSATEDANTGSISLHELEIQELALLADEMLFAQL